MNDQLMRIAQVGVANFGGYRRKTIRETGLFDIVACWDMNEQNLKAACEEEDAVACGSLEEILARDDIEAVVISTGANSHADYVVKTLEAGLHAFVEKPLCTSVEEVIAMREAARKYGKVVGVGHGYAPASSYVLLANELTASGRLGNVATYEENSSHSGGLEIRPGDWRGVADKNRGGMLLQCGVHALHGLCTMFGPVADVQAVFRYDVNHNTQTADVANVLIRHESGMVGTLNCYHVTAYCHEFRLFGTAGTVYVDTNLNRGWFQERRRNAVEERVEVPMPNVPSNAHLLNLINWYRAIREGTRPDPDLEDGIRAVLPVFASERSHKEGRRVSLSELTKELQLTK